MQARLPISWPISLSAPSMKACSGRSRYRHYGAGWGRSNEHIAITATCSRRSQPDWGRRMSYAARCKRTRWRTTVARTASGSPNTFCSAGWSGSRRGQVTLSAPSTALPKATTGIRIFARTGRIWCASLGGRTGSMPMCGRRQKNSGAATSRLAISCTSSKTLGSPPGRSGRRRKRLSGTASARRHSRLGVASWKRSATICARAICRRSYLPRKPISTGSTTCRANWRRASGWRHGSGRICATTR